MCICPDCETEDHPDHDTVAIEDEWTETKVGKRTEVTQRLLEVEQSRLKVECDR